jgi:hypothetical protein
MRAALVAHGIGGRNDLPLPLGWAITGAAAAVVVSFVLLGVLWREPRLDAEKAGRPLPGGLARFLDSPAFRRTLAGLGLLGAAWTLLALVFGPDDARNAVPYVVYVLVWVGLVPLSVLLGNVWRQVNPVRTVHRLLNRAAGLDPRDGVRPLPARLGWLPAATRPRSARCAGRSRCTPRSSSSRPCSTAAAGSTGATPSRRGPVSSGGSPRWGGAAPTGSSSSARRSWASTPSSRRPGSSRRSP